MKKILLGTTTLVGAAALFAGAALADTPKVTVGGYENFEVGVDMRDRLNGAASDFKAENGALAASRPQALRSDTQVDFKIDGKSDGGLGYGGEVDLLADTSGDAQGRGVNASKTFIYMDGMWGRVEMGSNVGADGTMKVDAGTIARATGGINGDWNYFASAANQFLAQAALPLGYGITGTQAGTQFGGATGISHNFTGDHTDENIDKITYYTPRFAGFQVGLSYMPDEINRGQGNGANLGVTPNPNGPDRTKNQPGLSQNIVSGGLNYDNKFGDIGFTAAATGEWGQAEQALYNNLAAWNVGGKVSYMGWSLAGSYGSWGKSNTLKSDSANSTHYWDVGAAYEYGPFGVSVTYLNSMFDCGNAVATGAGANSNCLTIGTNKFQSVSLGTDYKLAPGLTPYVEVTYFDERSSVLGTGVPSEASRDSKNNGTVGIFGTQLNF